MNPYFCNRTSETWQNLKELEDVVKDISVEPLLHVPGKLNPADLSTRSLATVDDMQEDGVWFTGPSFLQLAIKDMPLSRDFLSQGDELVPLEELRTKRVTLLLTAADIVEGGLFHLATCILSKTETLRKAACTFARIMKAYIMKDRQKIAEPVTAKEIQLAYHVLFAVSMEPTEEAIMKGQLNALRPFSSNSVFYTTGRIGKALEHLLGSGRLPVVMPSTELARLIMWQSHCEDHRRSPMDTLA